MSEKQIQELLEKDEPRNRSVDFLMDAEMEPFLVGFLTPRNWTRKPVSQPGENLSPSSVASFRIVLLMFRKKQNTTLINPPVFRCSGKKSQREQPKSPKATKTNLCWERHRQIGAGPVSGGFRAPFSTIGCPVRDEEIETRCSPGFV